MNKASRFFWLVDALAMRMWLSMETSSFFKEEE